MKSFLCLVIVLSLLTTHRSYAQNNQTLGYEAYLDEVRKVNGTYKGSNQNRDGAKGRESEADLVTAFTLIGQTEFKSDKRVPATPIISYDSLETNLYSLGVSKKTTFGLNAKLTFDATSTEYTDSNIGTFGGAATTVDAGPTISLTQSLWQNSFGALTQNTIEAKRAQARADYYGFQSTLDSTIQTALSAYWTLVLQRDVVRIRQLAVEQALAVYDYNSKRARMNLGDQADVLTAKASLESRKLDLQNAIDQEAIYRRTFNQYRNRPSMEDPGTLVMVDWKFLVSYQLPEKHSTRSDVKSAEFQALANVANSRVQAEMDRPVLDAYASYARNGRSNNSVGDSLSQFYQSNQPTTTVGVKLSMPLDFDSMNKAKQGAQAQASAAQMIFQQKVRDQEAEWNDLKSRVQDTQKRITLSQTIEEAQNSKLELEKKRLKQGRSSTYQVLLYEQDYTGSRLARLQTASDMITLLTRARLYLASEANEGTKGSDQ